ncbi:MAG: hypothetical protein HC804_06825 [Anaerolineae bacterium]|nr:hypothetical protein [Anaerolineae bacterium]
MAALKESTVTDNQAADNTPPSQKQRIRKQRMGQTAVLTAVNLALFPVFVVKKKSGWMSLVIW